MAAAGMTSALLSQADEGRGAESTDPIADLNLQFRELYKANRDELMPVTPLAGATLIGSGEVWRIESGVPVRSYPPISWLVHAKGLMHAVIATQATSARLVRSRDMKAAQADAGRLSKQLQNAQQLARESLPAIISPSVSSVIEALQRLADAWVAGKSATAAEFASAMNVVRPELDQIIRTIGEAVFDSVVRGLRQFAEESSVEEWQRCLIGVCGVGFARRDNIEIAAGMHVMGRETVGTRLLYLENAFTIEDGVRQLAASIADLELGRDVFGDPYRMWRDLLGDVAAAHAGGGFFPELGPGTDIGSR